MLEINFMIGGEAGQGVQSIGLLLAKALARWGYHVFADQDYESRVRGGHNFFRVRASEVPVNALTEVVDILIAFNKESVSLHQGELAKNGIIIYDAEKVENVAGNNLINVPTEKLAIDSVGDHIMANTVAFSAGLGIVDYDFDLLAGLLREFFPGESGEKNVKAAYAGYDYINKHTSNTFTKRLPRLNTLKRMVLNGNEAMALGAITAGCKFMAAYPMTPVSGIMEYLSSKAKDCDLVVVPAEDEIAAINMAVGAGYAGVRAMTATSGSGFCLMAEGLGLAGITETPVVIINGQRPGPAIGLPTRTEQGDLEFVLHAAHGEFPRAVLAPATIEECFWSIIKGFNLAEKYQLPVLIITDHHLASSFATVEPFDLSKVTADRGLLYGSDKESDYRRYALTDSGISPRAFPGKSKALVVADSDEHDEAGHLTEDAGTRNLMVEKRLRKLREMRKEIAVPYFYGPKRSQTLLIGWGSTFGALKEAADILRKNGEKVSLLHFSELWPFPAAETSKHIQNANRTFVVENNATGQLARLIRRETGIQVRGSVLKYDGRPFSPELVISGLRKEGF